MIWTVLAIALSTILLQVTVIIDNAISIPTMAVILAGLLTLYYRRRKKKENELGTAPKHESKH